jgi:hypothetical protein
MATVEACRAALGAPVTPPELPVEAGLGPFWYAGRSSIDLYWRRLRLHLTLRSVLLQNAVRNGIVLAAARLVAGAFDLSHGFWVLLATLSLMRTSAPDTRTTLRPAFLGTLAGALVGGLVITAVGPDRDVYAALTPLVLVAAFTAGPLLGVAWGQGCFALVVSFLFMQIAPATWHLAEARFVDVLVGGVTGAVAGLLAWPRGGGGELRRSVSTFLHCGSIAIRATAADLVGEGARGVAGATATDLAARGALQLAEASYIQYHTERPDPNLRGPVIQNAMGLGRFMVRGGEFLRLRYRDPPSEHLPATGLVTATAADASSVAERWSHVLTGDEPPPEPPSVPPLSAELDRLMDLLADGSVDRDVLRVADVEGWLAAALEYGRVIPAA